MSWFLKVEVPRILALLIKKRGILHPYLRQPRISPLGLSVSVLTVMAIIITVSAIPRNSPTIEVVPGVSTVTSIAVELMLCLDREAVAEAAAILLVITALRIVATPHIPDRANVRQNSGDVFPAIR